MAVHQVRELQCRQGKEGLQRQKGEDALRSKERRLSPLRQEDKGAR